MIDPILRNALLTATAMAAACAVLSVAVVLRRWAFIGEGVGHSALGGAGTAWLLALAFPALDNAWAPYVAVVIFCIATAVAIGWLSRDERVNADAAIGIFLVASLAWGILAQYVYQQQRRTMPAWFDTFFFGQMKDISTPYALAAVLVCAAVVVTLVALGKEVVAYCFDPLT